MYGYHQPAFLLLMALDGGTHFLSDLAALVELALYRMAQEALNNVARYAQASQAELSIHFLDDKIEMRVNDNGIGFEAPNTPADFAPSGHFGLLGMYERADLIGARLAIRSTPGQGTHLTVQLPWSS